MGRKFKIGVISLLLLALYGAYYWGIPAIFNSHENFQKAEKLIEKFSGFKVSLSNPHLRTGLLPTVKFSADGVSILNDDDSKALDTTNLNIEIKLLPLIFKNVNIKQLALDTANINFVYDNDGKFKLGQYELTNLPKSSFKINPKQIDIKNFNINFDNKISSERITLKGITTTDNNNINTTIKINENAKITSTMNAINNGIIINDMKISGHNVDAYASGKITKLNAQLPELDLKIGVNKSKAEDILKLIPDIPNLSPDMNIILTKQAGFWGNAQGHLEIKGKADYPNVYGKVLITDAYMVRPIPNSEKATIKIDFKGDKLDLDVLVPTSPTQKVIVKGPIKLDKDRYADLQISSTDNVDLKTAQIVLNPLHEIFNFELGPVPIMDIKGKGGIDLHVKGTKKDPYAWGEFKFNDAIVSFLDIHNMEISNGSGSLVFDKQNTVFESKTANLNGKPISIKGTCALTGDLNFDVNTNGQELGKLLNTIKTSPMLQDIQKLTAPVESASGPANLKLKLTGQVIDVNNIVFNKNLFAKGTIDLISNIVKIKNAPPAKVSGVLNFNNFDADFDLKSNLGNSQILINGKLKDDLANIKFSSPKFNLGDGIKAASLKSPYNNDLATINTSFSGKYNGKIDNVEPDKLYLKGKILSNNSVKSAISVNNSDYELNNGNLKLSKLEGKFNESPYSLTLNGTNIFSKNRNLNGYGKIEGFDLAVIHDLKEFLPPKVAKQLDNIEFKKGKIDISARAHNNNLNLYTVLDNFVLLYKPENIKIVLKSGNVLLQNNTLNLNKINVKFGNMPIFADGKIYNVQKNPNLNLYVNAKPSQDFFDQFFNKQSLYPIKLKGDAILTSKINGTLNNLVSKSTLDIKENSSLYYMGATIGDVENPVKIILDSIYSPNKIKINNLQYDKIIMSQNNKPFVNTQLNASGTMTMLKDNNVAFNNFKIKTQNPTDAKIFNIIFRKPLMKQGIFTSDIIINGTTLSPKILGKLDITSIDIPFMDSTVRDINIDFKNDKINILSKGKVLTNEVGLEAVMRNKLTPPYVVEDVKLKLADLNINKITDAIRDMEAEAARTLSVQQQTPTELDIAQLIVHNADIEADKIKVRNINADNFKAKLKITDKQLIDINDFKFDIAEGKVTGNFKYDIPKNSTNLIVHLDRANAAIMSEALFDLKGQVYGSINGDFDLACKGNSNDDCFKTLTGNGSFKVSDGRMPKLGSLEYLLKAGNLFKGGLTGLSVNGIIDLVTPLKTGNFESISGDMEIKEGIANEVNIYSSGSDLNMYMTGSYNIATSIADMKLVGSLSKNITTVFGKLKNVSLNTLFNTIPGVNDNTEKLLLQSDISKIPNIKDATDIYRIFAVEVNGDINGTDYVRSFKWVK